MARSSSSTSSRWTGFTPGQTTTLGHVPHDGGRLRPLYRRVAARRRHDAGGPRSFELFNSFWPEVARDPDSPRWTDEQRALTKAGAPVPTIVISDTLTGDLPNVRIIRRADAHPQIVDFKRQPGNTILITGSRTLWNDLLAHDLIDEIHLMIGSVVLGAGIPAFAGTPPAALRLAEVRSLAGLGRRPRPLRGPPPGYGGPVGNRGGL